MKIFVILVIKFFLISALFIVSNSNLHLKDTGERQVFLDSYYGWLDKVFGQARETAGYVVESRWLPEDSLGNPP